MTISTKREKHYIDLLPQISISWYGGKGISAIYIGWLMWNICLIS